MFLRKISNPKSQSLIQSEAVSPPEPSADHKITRSSNLRVEAELHRHTLVGPRLVKMPT
jgi:hypothetical protein